METNKFGTRIKELRNKKEYSQRELAQQIGVSFTYISKIENGTMPPPAKTVIEKLAMALDVDKDELLILAGRIPDDIKQLLASKNALEFLRSERTQKRIAKNSNRGGISTMKHLFSYKKLSRVALPALLTIAVAASLWFAAPLPARALNIAITPPAAATLGTTHSFTVTVSLPNPDLVPITGVTLEIYNSSNPGTYTATLSSLPLSNGGTVSSSGANGALSVTATSTANWQYFSGTGYAYWGGYGYSFTPSVGYGYGYGGSGTASITYSGNWTSPAGWPAGGYIVKLSIVTASRTFAQTSSSFALSGPVVSTPFSPITVTTPGLNPVPSLQVNSSGIVQTSSLLSTSDLKVSLNIPQGTRMLDASGNPLNAISSSVITAPPAPPPANAIVLAYNFGPDGATFAPPISLTITYDPASLPAGTNQNELFIAFWDGTKWVTLTGTVNTVTKTVTVQISHFTQFALMSKVPAPVTPPVIPPVIPPVAPPVTPPVAPPTTPVAPPVTPPVAPPTTPVAPPVTAPTAPVPSQTGISIWVWMIIGLAAVAVVTWIFIRRRKVY